MTALAIAALAWILLHLVVAGPLRAGLVGRVGLPAYRGLFSILSAICLAALIWTYRTAPYIEFWPSTGWVVMTPLVLMPAALLLLVGGLRPTNPTLAGPDMILDGALPVSGMIKITRHPMLWAFSLWAVSHMIANGDAATLLLGAAVLITAVNGMFSIDRKRAAVFGEEWQRFREKTSIMLFAASASGRNRLTFGDIGWLNVLGAAALFALILWGHEKVFGVPVYHL